MPPSTYGCQRCKACGIPFPWALCTQAEVDEVCDKPDLLTMSFGTINATLYTQVRRLMNQLHEQQSEMITRLYVGKAP